jgi:hypothetical protein
MGQFGFGFDRTGQGTYDIRDDNYKQYRERDDIHSAPHGISELAGSSGASQLLIFSLLLPTPSGKESCGLFVTQFS